MAETFGKYTLLRKLATGGMAQIYYARITGPSGFTKDLVVKKVLPELSRQTEFINMFADEARIVARMNHPNIVQVFDFGKIDDQYYIAMEFINGQDLKAVIRRFKTLGRTMNPRFALTVVRDIAKALNYAHNLRDENDNPLYLIHRDVTPRNILISYEGAVKLTDFGVAKARSRLTQTRTGVIKGKFPYMAPEQIMGKPVDSRMDIFSLSVVLWETLSLSRLFDGNSEAEILGQVLHRTVPSVKRYCPKHHKCVQAILNEGLSKDPDLRFQTAAEMERAINDCLSLLGGPEPDIGGILKEMFGIQAPSDTLIAVDQTIDLPQEATEIAEETDEPTLIYTEENPPAIPTTQKNKGSDKPKSFPVTRLLAGIAIVLFLAAGSWFYLNRSSHPLPARAPSPAKRPNPIRITQPLRIREASPTIPMDKHGQVSIPTKQQASKHVRPRVKAPGYLTINAIPWAIVWIDGKKRGITPLTNLKLSSGTHRILLKMNDKTKRFRLKIHPRRLTKKVIPMGKN